MTARVYNFYPGPATLPLPVLKEVQQNLLNYNNRGMSILEMSHRSPDVEELIQASEDMLLEQLNLSKEEYRVLFLQGGASAQFAMIPLNFLPKNSTADYVITGSFAEKAYKEAAKIGNVHIAHSTKETGHNRIPKIEELQLSKNPAYVHITSNNTIFGTQWQEFPDFEDMPLIADMSSDILSRTFNANKFALIYAGAQKNLGPAGVTVVIIRTDLLDKVPSSLPNIVRYDVHAEKNSLYNTPPVFAIYMVHQVLKWVKNSGGLKSLEEKNKKKANIIYEALDSNSDFYRPHAQKSSRSMMNITFRLPSEVLEKKFLEEASQEDLIGLKGHRSVGGIRASIYNAMPMEGCCKLATFMKHFCRTHS